MFRLLLLLCLRLSLPYSRSFLMYLRLFGTYLGDFRAYLSPCGIDETFFWHASTFLNLSPLLKCLRVIPDLFEMLFCLRPLLKQNLIKVFTKPCKALPDIFEILPIWFERICDVFQMLPLSLQHFLSFLRLFLVFETLPDYDFSWHVWNSSSFLRLLLMILRPYPK